MDTGHVRVSLLSYFIYICPMIKKGKVWVCSSNPANKLKDINSSGKWIYFESKEFMEMIFPKIDRLVEKGVIYSAKYAHRENKMKDPFFGDRPVLCVYADKYSKKVTQMHLRKLGIKIISWKYDIQTIFDWAHGGKLFEESKKRGYGLNR